MVEIEDPIDLDRWLSDRPSEDAVVIAVRIALRALPLIDNALEVNSYAHRAQIILPVFQSVSVAWGAALRLASGGAIRFAAEAAAEAAETAADLVGDYYGAAAVYTAYDAADAAAYHSTASAAVTRAAQSSEDLGVDAWKGILADAEALELKRSIENISAEPIWPTEPPEWAIRSLYALRSGLLAADEGWEVWTDWYDDRLHGRPFNKALEEARILIPDEIWEQGPKVVNAEIARLIEEHKTKPPPIPEMPGERGAPIHFEFRDGALHRAPPEPPHPPEDRRAAAERGWVALRQMLDDFLASGGGNQNPRLKTVLQRCGEGMGAEFDALDVILLGVYIARLQGFADRADEVLMPEDAAELVALNAQLGLFLAQFPEWADYARGIGDGFGTPEAEQRAVTDLNAALEQTRRDTPDLIAADAQDGLDGLAEAAMPVPSADDPTPIAPPVERRSYLRAGRSAFLAFASDAMARVRSGALEHYPLILVHTLNL